MAYFLTLSANHLASPMSSTILEGVLDWSKDRPSWQQDALRRLVRSGDLTESDILDLTKICKSAHGLDEPQAIVPLSIDDLPSGTSGNEAISLVSIFHHRGVNALAEDQTLNFSPGLTVVYGDNGAGKTGYIRILKSACRARGREHILGNVVAGVAPPSPDVSIKYSVRGEAAPREWIGAGEDRFISRVSVFDTRAASVYLTEKTDVAFRPFGLDLYDKLVRACRAVRAKLEAEQRSVSIRLVTPESMRLPTGTAAANLVANLSSLTNPDTVRALANFSPAEAGRIEFLEKLQLDLQAADPEKLLRELSLRQRRLHALAADLSKIEIGLSLEAISGIFEIRRAGRQKSAEAKSLRDVTFQSAVLAGTGSELWKELWGSARAFSERESYVGELFPVVHDAAKCVLCQQHFDAEARQRLTRFETFMASSVERELRQIREKYFVSKRSLDDLRGSFDSATPSIDEVRLDDEVLANIIAQSLSTNGIRRESVLAALSEDRDLASDCPDLMSVSHQVVKLAELVGQRIAQLRSPSSEPARLSAGSELNELRARKILGASERGLLAEIERQKRFAAYVLCVEDTRTHAITQKSTATTKAVVTQRLKDSFSDEISRLEFNHIEVELREEGGAEGIFYHKLVLARAPGVELPRVVSEGEQRCLSIAAFFAELSTADDPSGIVFDDPVSSLDYRWREAVARRLVSESRSRQVIVFTHDVVFLLLLKQIAEEHNVECLDQHVRQLPKGAGICESALPWVALPVRKKIGHLKNEWQALEKLHKEGQYTLYDKEARYLYGLLREAWERAIEEVLLGGIVERFRPSVQTLHIGTIADVESSDCQAVESAMTKCSKWLAGHDQAAAARAAIPSPQELRNDIESLERWVSNIRKRRAS